MRAVGLACTALLLAGCSLLTDAGDPATWLPTNIDGRRIGYSTYHADRFESRPVCACDDVITAAGGTLADATITRGAFGGDILVTAVRAPGVAPDVMLAPMLEVGQLEPRGQSQATVANREITIVTLPPYAAGKAYLAVARDALLLVYAHSDELAFAYLRALP